MADGGRNVTIIAGIYTLIQGLLWSLASIYYLAVHDCLLSNPLIDYTGNKENVNVYTLLYASYFNGSSCNNGGPIFKGISTPPPSSFRTYYLMYCYAIISSIWIPVSVLLVVSAIYKVRGAYGTYLYLPWIFVTFGITTVDIFGATFYSVDISNTLSADDYVHFLGAKSTWEEVTGVSKNGQDPAAPAVIMLLFCCRIILFWFLNVALIIHCIKECQRIRTLDLQSPITTDDIEDDERFRTWSRPDVNRPLHFNKNGKNINDQPKSPVKLNRGRKNGVAEVNINEDRNIIHENEQIIPENEQIEESRTNPRVLYKVDEFGIPIEEIRIPRLQNSYTESNGSDTTIGSPVFDYLGRPAQISRNREEYTNGIDAVRPKNLSSKEILRNQAPWSYLHPSLPPQISPPASPPIPAPDYAGSHPPKTQFSYTPSKPSQIKKRYSNRGVREVK